MKLLIVGLGSMGKRRARLTKGIDDAIQIVGVDTAEGRRVEAKNLGLADAAYATIAEAVAAEHPDAALVCTAPLSHAAVIGELLHIEDGVTRAGDWLQKKFGKMGPITDGFVSGSLVFAVGAMAVMGSLDSGLKNDHGILLAKSVIDFAGSVAFASSMGIGIVFSGLSVLAVEGVMTLLASLLTGVLTDAVITEISVTGSLMIIGISLNVLGVTKLRILNMTPALLLPVLLCKFM